MCTHTELIHLGERVDLYPIEEEMLPHGVLLGNWTPIFKVWIHLLHVSQRNMAALHMGYVMSYDKICSQKIGDL